MQQHLLLSRVTGHIPDAVYDTFEYFWGYNPEFGDPQWVIVTYPPRRVYKALQRLL